MHFMRQLMLPYCLRQLGKYRFVLLHREYVPIGVPKCGYDIGVEYQKHLDEHAFYMRKSLPQIAKSLGLEVTGDTLHFYNDGCLPEDAWPRYQSLLKKMLEWDISCTRAQFIRDGHVNPEFDAATTFEWQ